MKNVLGADEQVASLFIAIFSVGIAIGSVADQPPAQEPGLGPLRPGSVIAMGLFVLLLHFVALDLGQSTAPS